MLAIRKFKYFQNDLFNPDVFTEISEVEFINEVIKFRNCFEHHYLNSSVVEFSLKNNPLIKYRREVLNA